MLRNGPITRSEPGWERCATGTPTTTPSCADQRPRTTAYALSTVTNGVTPCSALNVRIAAACSAVSANSVRRPR